MTILDSCPQDSSVVEWTQFSHATFRWLTGAPRTNLIVVGMVLMTLLLLGGLLFRWVLRVTRKRPIKHIWALGFPLALFVTLSPLIIGEPVLTVFLPDYQGQTADAVVVLGRGDELSQTRVEMAADLILTERAPRVFVSGDGDALAMADALVAQGLDPATIAGEDCSRTTEENAQYTAKQLIPDGVKSIILISDPPHLLRSQLVFSSLGFEVIPYASPLPSYTSRRQRSLLALRESVGLVTYGLMGRYWPRPIAALPTTAAQ